MSVYDFEQYDWQPGTPWRYQSGAQVASMPPDVRKSFEDKQAEAVFGAGFKRDKHGKPIEQSRPLDQHHKAALEAEKRRLMMQAGVK